MGQGKQIAKRQDQVHLTEPPDGNGGDRQVRQRAGERYQEIDSRTAGVFTADIGSRPVNANGFYFGPAKSRDNRVANLMQHQAGQQQERKLQARRYERDGCEYQNCSRLEL